MLYTKIQPQSFLGSGIGDFLSLFNIYGHGGHLVQWHGTIRTNCQYPFNPEVILLLQSKFRLKSTIGLGRNVEN